MKTGSEIWFDAVEPAQVQGLVAGNMLEHLGMTFTRVGPDYLQATMPVDRRTKQPFGILHGGASVVLAETLGSVGANLCVDPSEKMCVGLDLSSNHIREISDGSVTGTARPLHLGGRTHVWEIKIEDEEGRLVNTTRLTLLVLDRPQIRR